MNALESPIFEKQSGAAAFQAHSGRGLKQRRAGRSEVPVPTPLHSQYPAAFNSKTRETESGCLEWMGARNDKRGGYGQLTVKGRKWRAHRYAWELAHGPIPDGLFVLHACDNPPCVRVGPGHLFLGTQTDNVQDCARKGRHKHAELPGALNPRARLSVADVEAIRAARADGALQQELADKYGVTQASISRIVRGESWKDATP